MTRPQLDDALRAAIERLYEVFASYPLRPDTQPCAHCVEGGLISRDTDARLHGKPLRELTLDDLYVYIEPALWTWGLVDDYRHFLPRILELNAWGELHDWYFPLAAKKLGEAELQNWPVGERQAVDVFMLALWRWALATPLIDPPRGYPVTGLLCGIAYVAGNLSPYLAAWQEGPALPGLLHLADLVIASTGLLIRGRLEGSHWDRYNKAHMEQIVRWLRRAETVQLLEDAYLAHADAPCADMLAEAADTLRPLVR